MRFERRPGCLLVIGGPVPPGAAAITLGRVIILRHGREASRYLLRHERVHVSQWRHFGVLGFLVRYLGAYGLWRLRRKGHWGAYVRIPFEIEADWLARRSLWTGDAAAGTGGPAHWRAPMP